MSSLKTFSCFLLMIFFFQRNLAQPPGQIVKIVIAPDHNNWTYHLGEKVKFSGTVLQYGHPIKNAKIYYEIGPEKMEPLKKDSMNLPDGKFVFEGGTMNTAGFLRCIVTAEVNGKRYRALATAGFDPETIKPAIEHPVDFTQFWDQAKVELSLIPMDAKMILLPERCTETVNVYQVNLQNYRLGARL